MDTLLTEGHKCNTIDSLPHHQNQWENKMNDLSQSILIDRYAREGEKTIGQVFRRVAGEIGQTPKEQIDFFHAMSEQRFIPAGRILAADNDRTYYNCYVLPSPEDSREGIVDTLGYMIEIMARGGGVGMNLSSLRPRGAVAKKVGGTSSGAVSWGGLYSFATGLVEQGGSRRGALMLILNDWHPDVLEFIDSKREAGKITNANISVAISDAFMEAVKEDKEWRFVFPDTTDSEYNELWNGDINEWKQFNMPVVQYGSMPARELWHKIMSSAWASAEPGVLFIDRANEMSNSWYYSKMISTNPCAEQWLSAWSVCNLGHINLSKMYSVHNGEKDVDWVKIIKTTKTAVRFLDNVIDITPYHFDQNEEVQKGERRIGLGTMGFAELLIHLGVRYGSDRSLEIADRIQRLITCTAYRESSDIALEKESFPEFDADKFLASKFCQQLPELLRIKIKQDGMRNVCLTTQAPTGTVGTMMNTSTGIEPFFSFSHYRKTRMGLFEEKHPIIEGVDEPEDYHVTTMDITPEEHVKVACAFQKWVDNAISKTVNLPNSATVEDVATIYNMLYENGGKGGTVYRDGSRDEQILHLTTKCEECGEKSVITESGCSTCQLCGWSKCDL